MRIEWDRLKNVFDAAFFGTDWLNLFKVKPINPVGKRNDAKTLATFNDTELITVEYAFLHEVS
ncbi:hypothetical protein D3C72_1280290 [compost metagenome]